MPAPEPPLPVFATFNDATLEVICHFDRRLRPGTVNFANWDGSINRLGARWNFGAVPNPVANNRQVTFTANIIGPHIPGPNRLRYAALFPPLVTGYTGADAALFTLFNFTLI